MSNEYDRWNDLLDWLYATPKDTMSVHLRAARQVTLFHGEVCNGGLHDKLAYRDDEYPHAELVWSYERVCGEPAVGLIREGLDLLKRPDPTASFPDEARVALVIAADSVSRGNDLKATIEVIGSVFPDSPASLRALAYEAALAQAQHFEPWKALDLKYFQIGDRQIFGAVARYAEDFSCEWSSRDH